MARKLQENLRRVRDRMAEACSRARRPADSVKLIAVTKSVGIDTIRSLLALGQADVAEDRPQEFAQRAAMIHEQYQRQNLVSAAAGVTMPRWHMIGHLQRNKVKSVVPWVEMVHSLDSLRLAEELSAAAVKCGRIIDALIEVNAADEPQKHGVAVGAVNHLAEQIVSLPGLRIRGMMSMAPLGVDEKRLHWVFGRVQEVFQDLARERFIGPDFQHLSMGMSGDFETAISHGATMVRLGRVLFEGIEPAAAGPSSPPVEEH